ncbi:hypothetical protein QC764_0006920 [Podospora pseudoanserina]|uniref:Uncharacterized protein n=1 Tax=Podospora pseudoanserina TaxID=2609844 RepID=A0ABR0IM14_9PEZI|nr:hypothetical protein QC764_0006920 [Podospora pseudoanserina]
MEHIVALCSLETYVLFAFGTITNIDPFGNDIMFRYRMAGFVLVLFSYIPRDFQPILHYPWTPEKSFAELPLIQWAAARQAESERAQVPRTLGWAIPSDLL